MASIGLRWTSPPRSVLAAARSTGPGARPSAHRTGPRRSVVLIERRPYGLKLTFEGTIPADTMRRWSDESHAVLQGLAPGFGVVVDMRSLATLSPEARAVMEAGQLLYRQCGLERSAVGLSSAILALQFTSIARESGIDAMERYLDATRDPEWEAHAERWVVEAIEPPLRSSPR